MFLKPEYKRDKVIEAILLRTDCKTEEQAIKYLESMYDDGVSLDECYHFFVIMAPSGI